MTCPHCQADARFVNYRPKCVTTLLGDIRLQRGYYHCRHCAQGCFPWDGTLRVLDRRTPGAEEVIVLLGTLDSFVKVAERTLYKTTGLQVCESTVQRATEAVGQRLGALLASAKLTFTPEQPWPWHWDATGQACAYVSVDATGVLMQGPGAAKADGRMAWVGMLFNPQPLAAEDRDVCKPCDNVFYLAGHDGLEALGRQLRRQADALGIKAARQWIALTDGGNGLEDWVDLHFPRSIKILDFRHAAEHLGNFAKVYAPSAQQDASTLLSAWCHRLKHEGGEPLVAELEQLDRRRLNAAAREEHRKLLQYLRNNVPRMKYPEYVAKGWQIATGAVESACKTVVNQRLCLGGMRWVEAGSDAVCHLRALYRSDEEHWDHYWARHTAA
jgi:hypothetical protein